LLPAAIDIVETILRGSYTKELRRKFPLAHNSMGRRASDISVDLCEQLIRQIKTSRSALQVHEATEIVNYV
jgi:hypothetical protein